MRPTLKKGDQGPYVKELQQYLGLAQDGIFGAVTEQHVIKFQSAQGLYPDGVVGNQTWQKLSPITPQNTSFHACVARFVPLLDGQFNPDKTTKKGVTLHHTVSDGNPDTVVRVWNQDSRGAVGTHFVIGRETLSGNKDNDGTIIQTMPIDAWGWHMLTTRMGFSSQHNTLANQMYIGIELCSLGCLKKVGDKFYTIDSTIEIPKNQVCTLETPFRTYKYWHKYTSEQIDALYELLIALQDHFTFRYAKDIEIGVKVDENWAELSWDAMNFNRVLTSHTSFEAGKFDIFPQPELLEMLHKVYYGA
jgi:N-acetyl-anhydromuramyl-L-alanine amidase AmpD